MMLLRVLTLVLLWTVCAADEDSTQITTDHRNRRNIDCFTPDIRAFGSVLTKVEYSSDESCIELCLTTEGCTSVVISPQSWAYTECFVIGDYTLDGGYAWKTAERKCFDEHSENPECDLLDDGVNVLWMDPYSPTYSYKDGAKATITCLDNYIISWASSIDDVVGDVQCDAGSFVPDPVDSFAGAVGCVACVDNIVGAECVDGTCTEGVCVCNANYKKSLTDPRLCTIIQCDAFYLYNQAVSEDGPYDVDAVVTVTCTDGYHVSGELKDVAVQTLTCGSEGYFDELLEPCVVCADDNDCTDGICNSNNICECDATSDYKLKEDDLNVCEKVTCPENYCAHGGECSVKDLELECDCPLGTEGDTCNEFTSDPCSPDPCKNGATCSRVMTDPADFTKHECNDVRYHIRGPGWHGEAVIGTGSSITCSVAAPEEDDTFEMEINGYIWNSDSLEGAWSEAGFSKSVYNYENGTIETRIEGFVESFTKEHDMTIIKCHSYKYEGEVDMTIKIQESDVRYHIRGPGRHNEAVIGTGSSITCSIAAPEEDDTFDMEINGNSWGRGELEGPWTEAGFARSVYVHRNGTISTNIEGFVESFTKEHDMAIIKCHSWKYEGGVDMTIKIQENNEVDGLHFGGVKLMMKLPEFDWSWPTWPFGI